MPANVNFKQILRYLLSGFAGLAANLSGFNICLLLGMHYVPASIIGFASGVLVSFVCQKFFTFQNRAAGETGKQFAAHIALLAFNLAATTLIIIGLVEALAAPKNLSVLAANGLAALWSFILYKRFVFPNRHSNV